MKSLSSYAYINAKLRAMLSKGSYPDFWDKLINTVNPMETLNALKGTSYKTSITSINTYSDIELVEEKLSAGLLGDYNKIAGSLADFAREIILNIFDGKLLYNSNHLKISILLKKLSDGDRSIVQRLLGIIYDVNNILIAVRMRFYGQLSARNTLGDFIEGGFFVSKRLMAQALDSDSIGQMLGVLAVGPYKMLDVYREKSFDISELASMELALRKVIIEQAYRILRGFPFTLGMVASYFIVRMAQIQGICAVLYAKHYSLDRDAIEGQILC